MAEHIFDGGILLAAAAEEPVAEENSFDALKTKYKQLEKTASWWSECASGWREKWGVMRTKRNALNQELDMLNGKYKAVVEEFRESCAESRRMKRDFDTVSKQYKVSAEECRALQVEVSALKQMLEGGTKKQIARVEPRVDSSSEVVLSKPPSCFPNLQQTLDSLEIAYGESGDFIEMFSRVKEFLSNCDVFYSKIEKENRTLRLEIGGQQSKHNLPTNLKKKNDSPLRENNEDVASDETQSCCNTSNINALRLELRHLQEENYKEWSKREQCESGVFKLERQLNRANQTIMELEGTVNKKSEEVASAQTTGMKLLRDEMDSKSTELVETKSLLNKTRRLLQEKEDEAKHDKMRADKSEDEIKKLRQRIDELKKNIAKNDELVDGKENTCRRLNRTIDELSHRNEALQTQLDIATRMKRQSTLIRPANRKAEGT